MNAKLAHEVGRRLGMKKAAKPIPQRFRAIADARSAAQGEAAPATPAAPAAPVAPVAGSKPGVGAAGDFKALAGGGGVQSLSDVGAGGAGGVQELAGGGGVQSLGMDKNIRKRIQDGMDPTQAGAYGDKGQGAAQGGGGKSPYADFGPQQMQDYMKQHFGTMTGFSGPDEYSAWQQSRNAGMGRAMRAAANRRWLRGMFQS